MWLSAAEEEERKAGKKCQNVCSPQTRGGFRVPRERGGREVARTGAGPERPVQEILAIVAVDVRNVLRNGRDT